MATKKEIIDTAIAAMKTECGSDRDKLFKWYSDAANRFASRAQKLQQNTALDAQSFLTAQATSFAAHQAAKDAERAANGDAEE